MSETTLDILEKLIAFDTVSSKCNLPLIDYVQSFLATRGFDVTRIPDDTGRKAGLFAQIGPAGDGIMLSAHTDVVPVDGQDWSFDPFRLTRRDDRLYGRGTCDMKGFLAAMLFTADKATGMELSHPLKLSISYDEEVGCVGIQHMQPTLTGLVGRPKVCLVGEPTEMQVATGHKGKASYRATFNGNEGHSASAPLFANAIYMATEFAQALRDLQSDYEGNGNRDTQYEIPYSTIHIGKLSGGVALNVVPATAQMEFEFRHLAADPTMAFDATVQLAAAKVSSRFRPLHEEAQIQVRQFAGYPGLETTESDPAVAFAKAMSTCNHTTKVSFGTEAGIFAELGIPTIVCGPGSMQEQGHKPDEYLEIGQLYRCEEMLSQILHSLVE